MRDEEVLLAALAGGLGVASPEEASPRYRGEVMRLMAVFVDSEMAGAAGFADCINCAPGLEERMAASRIVLEKFGHARRVLKLMEAFGARSDLYVSAHPWAARLDRSADLGTRRSGSDMRLNVFHYPLQGWLDAVTMNFLMGAATSIQLAELETCSYRPLAQAMREIAAVERRHAELGEAGLRAALAAGSDPVAAQAAVNYWRPRVAATFGRTESDRFVTYRKYGLRGRANEELLAEWRSRTGATLAALGLAAP